MTAEEFVEQTFIIGIDEPFIGEDWKNIKKLMQDFAKLKCEEQKQLCIDELKSCLKYDVGWTLQVYETNLLETELPEF